MCTVVNSREVAHLWAHQLQEHARTSNGSVSFQGKVIYSYGHHFPIAMFVRDAQGQEAILFTTRTYSKTTAKHIGYVRMAISHRRGDTFNVPLAGNMYERDYTRDDQIEAYVRSYQERINELEAKMTSARKPERYLGALESLIEEANRFCARFGRSERFTSPDEDAIKLIRECTRAGRKLISIW